MPEDVKLVVLGSSGVGKTSLILRFVTENFKAETDSTVGASYMTKIVSVGNSYMKFNIWDTAGQERFRSIVHMYYKEVGVAVLVYDLTNPESFAQLTWWYNEMRQHIAYDLIIAVVANKEDLVVNEKVTLEEARAFADSIGALYFRTSAKSNHGITDLFSNIASLVMQKRSQTAQLKRSLTLRSDHSKERVELVKKGGCCA
mmetsp:Transcript_13033/g.24258  ORF Transcript_13033/g.24258 Transcript_13033/m.24258 type:complete len:201 (-) Transcript_13033:1360-1962(-)